MLAREAFAHLKQDLVRQYQTAYPHFQGTLADFRQQDIAQLQALLMEKVQGRVSEKWFYTHLKGKPQDKLPRIDMLNLLARFVGADSWAAYAGQVAAKSKPSVHTSNWPRWWWLVPVLLIILGWRWAMWEQPMDLYLQFVDALRQVPITETNVQVQVVTPDQQTELFFSNEQGQVILPEVADVVTIYTQAAYYLPDTLQLRPQTEEHLVALQSDDYALMIHYFSTAKVEDWKRRREQLDQAFADEAVIYQLDPQGQLGMDMLNKQEFINKLTIPINSLRNVKVWKTRYAAGQIVELRFSVD
ncbi:MAG: hypothetical protein AAGJ82_13440 [Bacteroidota bacterium]